MHTAKAVVTTIRLGLMFATDELTEYKATSSYRASLVPYKNTISMILARVCELIKYSGQSVNDRVVVTNVKCMKTETHSQLRASCSTAKHTHTQCVNRTAPQNCDQLLYCQRVK